MIDPHKHDKFFKIPIMIWVIGASALLTNLSSIMIFSLVPIYLTQVFGMTTLHLGILEGFVEFCSWAIRVFSGVLSDYLKKRKPLLIIAYALTTLARPLFALAPSIGWIYCGKFVDRISNGLQATPREALVGDIAPKEKSGACYGLRQALGFAGSILGAISVIFLMTSLKNNFNLIFWIAGIPSFLALLGMIFFVKDVSTTSDLTKKRREPFSTLLKKVPHLNAAFWMLILVSGIFMVSNFSGAYRILQANRVGLPAESVSLVMLVQNIGALAAFPIGKLSDRYDKKLLLALGFITTILANLFFGFTHTVTGVLIGATLWGIQMGVTQSIFQAMIADTVHPDLRGTGFGIYYLVTAFSLFGANALMGFLFNSYSPTIAFMFSALVALLGLSLTTVLKSSKKKQTVTI